ncbi:MAG: T9SS type A sorting domain-containing protein [Tannerella sp.]|nr:T9SS type A sorting domain-containing protein [Tannerella sp.]
MTVYSLSGAVMYRAQKTASPATFDLSGLPKGVFIIRGSSGWTEKVIK